MLSNQIPPAQISVRLSPDKAGNSEKAAARKGSRLFYCL